MEVTGDRLVKYGGNVTVLPRASARAGSGTWAADYAALVEELSRTMEYLQILAAGTPRYCRTPLAE